MYLNTMDWKISPASLLEYRYNVLNPSHVFFKHIKDLNVSTGSIFLLITLLFSSCVIEVLTANIYILLTIIL